jgi:uncharacterized protein YqjF (DUF2071 family)
LRPAADSLDAWLTERYRLYALGKDSLLQGTAEHPPWETQEINGRVECNTIGRPFGLSLGSEPDSMHFSPGVAARFGAFTSCECG